MAMRLLLMMNACLAMMTASLWRAQTTRYEEDGKEWENPPEGKDHPLCAADPTHCSDGIDTSAGAVTRPAGSRGPSGGGAAACLR